METLLGQSITSGAWLGKGKQTDVKSNSLSHIIFDNEEIKMDVELRPATSDDSFALAKMNHELILDEGCRNPMSIDELELRMRNWLESTYKAVLFYHEAEIVGYSLYQEQSDEYFQDKIDVYLRQFFIKRHHRGRGFGRKAFEKLYDEVINAGSTITVDALESNPGGQAFWQKVGFKSYYVRYKFHNNRA